MSGGSQSTRERTGSGHGLGGRNRPAKVSISFAGFGVASLANFYL
ncbi:hypothetical protein [Streptomyces sp. NPDC055140]